jgi:uncharacterized protein YkwD
MRFLRVVASPGPARGAAILVATLTLAPSSALACTGTGRQPTDDARTQRAVLCLVNRERARHDLSRLRRRDDLGRAARRYAGEMVRRGFFSHVSPDGVTMVDRLRAVGYVRDGDAWSVGEDLAWGTGARATPAAIVDAWLASPPHRRILLTPGDRDIGVGVAQGVPVDPAPGEGATYAAELGVRR